MTTTALDIYNLALAAVNAGGRVSSLSEASREREECEQWYDLVRRTVQEAAYWPGSRAVNHLALLSSRQPNADWVSDSPDPRYLYQFAIPEDYLRAWYLTDYSKFNIGTNGAGDQWVINANCLQAVLVYARDQKNVRLWTEGQKLATAYGLAAHIAGPLTGSRAMMEKNTALANRFILEAQNNAADAEENNDVEEIPMVLAARGYGGPAALTRYYYPHSSVFGGNVSG